MSDPVAADPAFAFTAAIVKPRHALAKMGIRLPVLRLRGNPLLWKYLPLGLVARTLIDHGLVDRKSVFPSPDIMRGPGFWLFQWRDRPRNVRAALYEWLNDEWNRYGWIIAESRRYLTQWELEQSAVAPEWVASATALLRVRDTLAMNAGLVPWPTLHDGFPKTANDEIVDFIHAVDQSLDRIQDTLRRILLDRLVRDECSEEERAEAVMLLQRDYDDGRWPRAVADLNDACGAPEPALLMDAILRSLPARP